MKNLLFLLFICLTAGACQKNVSAEETKELELVASKSTVRKGETVDVSIRNPASGSYTKWTVTPSTGVAVRNLYTPQNAAGNTIQFGEKGEYEISADVRLVHPDCRPSPGWDTCFANVANKAILTYKIKVQD